MDTSKLTVDELDDYNRTLELFRKAWGYAIPDALLEHRAMKAVLERRRMKGDKNDKGRTNKKR